MDRVILEPKIIESDEEYAAFTASLEFTSRAPPETNSAPHARESLIRKLLDDYARKRMALACEDPVDAIQFRMQELGMRQKDLAAVLGGRNRASEILARKRSLSLVMIRALVRQLGIPAEMLIKHNRTTANATKASAAKAPARDT